MSGVSIGGAGVVATGTFTGIAISAGGVVGTEGVRGFALGGFGVVSDPGEIRGIALSLGRVDSPEEIRGAAVGGYRVKAPEISGLAASVLMNRSQDFAGFGVAGYNEVRGTQRGIVIGLFNTAEVLRGLQIGLLNHAGNNPPPFRWLPILNAHF
jgi:hypothetical protein